MPYDRYTEDIEHFYVKNSSFAKLHDDLYRIHNMFLGEVQKQEFGPDSSMSCKR